jgi:hypothetical protein
MTDITKRLDVPQDLDLSALDQSLDEWAQQFPKAALRKALDQVIRRQDALSRVRQDLEARLAMYEKLASPLGVAVEDTVTNVAENTSTLLELKRLTAAHGEATSRRHSPKRQVISQQLGREPGRRFSLSMIHSKLVEHGLSKDNARDKKALSVMLAGMVDRGEVHRPARGLYQFGPGSPGQQAAALTDVQGKGGEAT